MHLADEQATLALGAALAGVVRPGDVIALNGDLGSGKTTLARGLLSALGLEEEAPSPSFAIVQPYAPPEIHIPVLHCDLYRLDDVQDVRELGLDDMLDDHVLLIEWPERMGAELWQHSLILHFSQSDKGGRHLTATVPAAWENRWPIL